MRNLLHKCQYAYYQLQRFTTHALQNLVNRNIKSIDGKELANNGCFRDIEGALRVTIALCNAAYVNGVDNKICNSLQGVIIFPLF